jgi:hypothetical protein
MRGLRRPKLRRNWRAFSSASGPSLLSAATSVDGTQVLFTFDRPATYVSNSPPNDVVVSGTGGDGTMDYASGSGTTVVTFSFASTPVAAYGNTLSAAFAAGIFTGVAAQTNFPVQNNVPSFSFFGARFFGHRMFGKRMFG